MATCGENVVQLRPNFRVTIASGPSDPRGEAESQGGGAVGNVVRTCLRWEHVETLTLSLPKGAARLAQQPAGYSSITGGGQVGVRL